VFAKLMSGALILVILLVAGLVALYFFAIRPIIDTADDAIGGLGSFDGISQEIQESLDDAGIEGLDLGDLSAGEITRQEAKKLAACIDAARDDLAAVRACAERFQ